ncbi:DoxX family protein [Microvirga sp. 3-52]|nr:DoxX family protein [Microvirga sp. 3-52]
MLSRSEDFALLLGRLFVAALFLPSGFNKLMAFSTFTSSLAAKGVPYSAVIAGVMVAAEFFGPLALLIGLWPRRTALALIAFMGVILWMTYGKSGLNMLLRPQQSVELFERLAIIGGLLFYFSSGPGGWSRTSLR